MLVEFVTILCVLALAGALTMRMRSMALMLGMVDVPNARSSHTAPTPRGGGVAIVVASSAGFAALALTDQIATDLFMALIGGGVCVAAVGFIDDRTSLPPVVRLAAHVVAAVWALYWLGNLPPLSIAGRTIDPGWIGYAIGVLGITWAVNLFNFMDGIDGIAASEAVFVACGGALLAFLSGTPGIIGAALVLAAACAGFLRWNWAPARIFMGDVGSGYLGYALAVLALGGSRDKSSVLLGWFLLGGAFIVDATVTLLRRLLRRERLHEAHRSHAYQWLARRWGDHRRVTLLALALNAGWLLPWAVASVLNERLAGWFAGIALAPVIAGALWAGAGRREDKAKST